MPLGKIAAQCAHALNSAVISRMSTTYIDDKIVLTPSNKLKEIIENFYAIDIELVYAPLKELKEKAENPTAIIEDSGRTVFGEPTITVSWSTDGWGTEVPINERLPYKTGDILFKQPILVNRSNPYHTPEIIIKNVAIASTVMILESYNDEVLTLHANSPTAIWLQNSFGKTVLGCKKQKNYDAATLNIIEGTKLPAIELDSWLEPSVFTCPPIAAKEIEIYTKTKHTRLL